MYMYLSGPHRSHLSFIPAYRVWSSICDEQDAGAMGCWGSFVHSFVVHLLFVVVTDRDQEAGCTLIYALEGKMYF